jgi:2-oxoglutarate ferredoxin oxidoreductase subunit alpha
MAKKLMKGNEAIGEAAIRAGARAYFCYPITPQTEVAEYLAKRMPEVGGVFLQGESELAVSNMLFGAAGAGARVFTSSSSPGISLMQEALSYIAGAQLPVVVVNIVRGGPGLGGILPAQSDYFQAVKGGGHGDYRLLVLSPASVQEAVDLTMKAFTLADRYRNPVMILGDGMIGQMMEPVEFHPLEEENLPPKDWATTGAKGRPPNIVKSLYLDPLALEENNRRLQRKYEEMKRKEVRFERWQCAPGLRALLVAHGTMARICKTAIDQLRVGGVEVGLFRPISLFPFPEAAIRKAAGEAELVLTVEMSMGQMVEDVERAVAGASPVHFFGRAGGVVPSPEEVAGEVRRLLGVPPEGRRKRRPGRGEAIGTDGQRGSKRPARKGGAAATGPQAARPGRRGTAAGPDAARPGRRAAATGKETPSPVRKVRASGAGEEAARITRRGLAAGGGRQGGQQGPGRKGGTGSTGRPGSAGSRGRKGGAGGSGRVGKGTGRSRRAG